jgi:CheY-like chemotaxis protein
MPESSSHRILLAEEQAASRDFIARLLGTLGHRIETVTTSHQVLERLSTGDISLILLSTALAGRVGTELLHEIRARGSGSVRVAMIGSDRGECARQSWLDAGAVDYLGRPVNVQDLLRVIERAGPDRPPTAINQRPSVPVIDLEHFSGFSDGDLQLEAELLILFLSSAEGYLARMAEALRTGQGWTAVAHALKGSSANLGARRVMELALAAEHLPPSLAQLEALRAAIEEVRGFERTRH